MDRLYYLDALIPAGTPIASPYTLTWPLEDNKCEYIDFLVPPGPSGYMGFRLLWASQQVIPWGNNSWIVTDNENRRFDCDFDMTSTGLVFQGYNLGSFQHSVYLRALIKTVSIQEAIQASAITGSLTVPGSQVMPTSLTGEEPIPVALSSV